MKSRNASTLLQQDVLAMRHDLSPVVSPGAAHRRLHESEVGGVEIGSNQESITVVGDVVLDTSLPGCDDDRLGHGVIGVDEIGTRSSACGPTR